MAKPETDNAEALMSAYLDEELDAEGKSKLDEMLATSPEVQKELSGLQNMLRLVKGLPEEQAPPDFYEKVAKKIRRRRWLRGEYLIALSLPFQIINVLVILAVAVVYMMLHLDGDVSKAKLERDPTVQQAKQPAPAEPAPRPSGPEPAPPDMP
jgi:anti-sigma factor RsiW